MTHPGRITLIAAVAANGVIGDRNTVPWRLSEDLRHFKTLTLGHPVIMGRKTFESLGRPLPERSNIVVTRSPDYEATGCTVVGSIDAAFAAAACDIATRRGADEVFVIGGAEIYAQALVVANRLELTEIQSEFPGDTYFPDVDWSQWRETQRTSHISQSRLAFDFVTYERR
jgi:dihydrofolate reductase